MLFSRDQAFLLLPDLKAWLPEDDLAHFVVVVVERARPGTFEVPGRTEGEPQYHPRLMLALLVSNNANGLFSSRPIKRATYRNIAVRLIAANLSPDQDAVRGLNTGPDDYITKPFNIEALLARMRALLRRPSTVPVKGQLAFHDIAMDLASHRVTRNERRVHLGPTEFRLLEFFMQHPRRVFSREELLDAVWGPNIHVEPRTVNVHIRRLRKSINGADEPDVVRTVRTAGYALDTEPL